SHNVGHDRSQLANMARQTKEMTGADGLTILADRGYFSGEEIVACEAAGVRPIVPKPLTSGAKADGRFGKHDFIYHPETDTHRSRRAAGEQLTSRSNTVESGLKFSRYWSSNCGTCAMKAKCTPGQQRRISRWEREAVIESMQRRLDEMPNAMRVRRSIVEHVFGTIKDWMGRGPLLKPKQGNVGTGMGPPPLALTPETAQALA